MSVTDRSLLHVALFGLLLSLLSACGPIYKTVYTFVPPASGEGRRCLNQCLGMREMCRSSAEYRAAQSRALCEQSAMMSYSACLGSARNDKERSRCSHYSSGCYESAYTQHCESDYRLCYSNCGGVVDNRQVCVMGCGK